MNIIIRHIKKVYLTGLMLMLFLSSCDQFDARLIIANKSENEIFFNLSQTDSVIEYSPLRTYNNDTILEESNYLLPSDSMHQLAMGVNMWERHINEECQDSTLRVFFFDKELIMEIPWDTILKKQLYTKKLEYTVSDLEKVNWKVVYE